METVFKKHINHIIIDYNGGFMGEVFKAKIRPIGSSACVIIPAEQLAESNAKIGDEIKVALLPLKKDHSLFGSVKEIVPFERDKKVREFK